MPSEIDTSIERRDSESATVEDETTEPTDARVADDVVESEVSDESETDQDPDDPETAKDPKTAEPPKNSRPINWWRIFGFVVLPALALMLGGAAGYLKWLNTSDRSAGIARIESVAAAKDTTIALLSYKPDSVEKDLNSARDRLTGTFKDSYTQLIHDVVIPGAKQKHITAIASVPAVASVKVTPSHAVVLLYVDQTTVIGTDTPSDSVSTVRVTLDNVDGKWLVSEFDPI